MIEWQEGGADSEIWEERVTMQERTDLLLFAIIGLIKVINFLLTFALHFVILFLSMLFGLQFVECWFESN